MKNIPWALIHVGVRIITGSWRATFYAYDFVDITHASVKTYRHHSRDSNIAVCNIISVILLCIKYVALKNDYVKRYRYSRYIHNIIDKQQHVYRQHAKSVIRRKSKKKKNQCLTRIILRSILKYLKLIFQSLHVNNNYIRIQPVKIRVVVQLGAPACICNAFIRARAKKNKFIRKNTFFSFI